MSTSFNLDDTLPAAVRADPGVNGQTAPTHDGRFALLQRASSARA